MRPAHARFMDSNVGSQIMTMPHERTRALVWAGGFLVDLAHNKKLPVEVRRSAVVIARHFPTIERSEEHTSELQSLMRISYAVFCLKKNINKHKYTTLQYTALLNDMPSRQKTQQITQHYRYNHHK